jgi:hypothetical protein
MNNIAEQARLRASLEELARFGSRVDVSVADTRVENEKVEIEQVGWVHGARLFELPDGRVAYMAEIAVTNQTSRTIDLIDVELRTPWDDSLFQWLTPFQVKPQSRTKRERSYSVYRFSCGHGLQLEYNEVINHHLLERRKLPGKRRLEGWLLAIGGRMPAELCDGQWQDLEFTIIGADHAEYSMPITLCTERLPARTKVVKPRISMFGKGLEEDMALARDVTGTPPQPTSQPPADADHHTGE